MSVKLRNISEQVMVITGATSGIGLCTARMAAEQGARLVLVARSSDALDQLASELRRKGTQAATVVADVGNVADVERIGQTAMERFGRIDTWVNNAGISVYGRCEEVPLEDQQRVLQTNFWGAVYGSLEAVRRMKTRGGGALINIGAAESDRAIPLQGIYCASKQALRAYTDTLRMELEEEQAPISVTLIRPSSVDTMFTVHAKNFMDKEPALPAPLFAPDVVAKTIVYAAQHPKRDVFVGVRCKMLSLGSVTVPGILDRVMRKRSFNQQQSTAESAPGRHDALYAPDSEQGLRERAGLSENVIERDAYSAVSLRATPVTTALFGGGALFAAWGLLRRLAR